MKYVSKLAIAAVAASLILPAVSLAGGYPTNKCVSKKTKAAGKLCGSALKAWSKYHGNPAADPGGTARDASIQNAADKLALLWGKAESSAAKKSAECAATTVTDAEAVASITAAIDAFQATLGASVDSSDEKCRAKALKTAAKLCGGYLKSQSKYIQDPTKDPDQTRLGEGRTKSLDKFTAKYDQAAADCTTAIPDPATAEADIDGINDAVADDTTTSPNGPTAFEQVIPGSEVVYDGRLLEPRCSRDTPYSFFWKRGTVNKLLMYYQGGGACWDGLTCWTSPTYKIDAGAGDNPDLAGTGFADPDNVLNLFKDWHVVFVSYCTGDVHWGENGQSYGAGKFTYHYGRVNAAVAEKFAREHFLDPEQVFVTGSSAGAYGAIWNSTFLMDQIYPQSEFMVLGDAGAGVITTTWLNTNISKWRVDKNLPTFIPGIELPIEELSLVELYEAIAAAFPDNRFAQYQSAYDGGNGGQTSFYHVMKNPGNPLIWTQWWLDQCEWTVCMRDFVADIAASVPNFRHYTGAGSRHTVWGSDKLYVDTTGGVPPLVDWIDAMINDDVGWVNVDCQDGADCNLVDTCQGGPNAGLACTSDVDCLPLGTACVLDVCVGGIDDGQPCVDAGDCDDFFCDDDPHPDPEVDPYFPGGVVSCAPTVCPCGGGGVNCP